MKARSILAATALAVALVPLAVPAEATPTPALPAPMVYSGQKIGNSSASDYRLGIYTTGGYTPYVSLKIDGTYTVGTDRFSSDGLRVQLSGKSWKQKWYPDTTYGACHATPAGRLVKPPTSTPKVTYKTYSGSGC